MLVLSANVAIFYELYNDKIMVVMIMTWNNQNNYSIAMWRLHLCIVQLYEIS